MISAETLACWKTNYGLVTRTPEDAADWWRECSGGAELSAPAGAVAALGIVIAELERVYRESDNVARL